MAATRERPTTPKAGHCMRYGTRLPRPQRKPLVDSAWHLMERVGLDDVVIVVRRAAECGPSEQCCFDTFCSCQGCHGDHEQWWHSCRRCARGYRCPNEDGVRNMRCAMCPSSSLCRSCTVQEVEVMVKQRCRLPRDLVALILRFTDVEEMIALRWALRAPPPAAVLTAPRPPPASLEVNDLALGCVMGALVGDAAGAFLEHKAQPTADQLERAMALPGGGCHELNPGQVTDDGELSMCLLRALVRSGWVPVIRERNSTDTTTPTVARPGGSFKASRGLPVRKGKVFSLATESGAMSWLAHFVPAVPIPRAPQHSRGDGAPSYPGTHCIDLNEVARWYGKWKASKPFDMGGRCRAALGKGLNQRDHAAALCMKAARVGNERSETKANGGLMRLTPLAVFLHRLPAPAVAFFAAADALLSHASPTCQFANAAYALAIRHLLQHCGDASGAVTSARAWVAEQRNREVLQWLDDAVQGTLTQCNVSEGFVKHAFVLAFYHLQRSTPYTEALRHTIAQGGDTDTNACIVGGLLGACYGASGLPAAMVERVLQCKPARGKRKRPQFLWPSAVPGLIDQLLHAAPTEFTFRT